MNDFHSKFGGLWIDNIDQSQVQAKLDALTNKTVRQQVQSFIRDGFVIIPGAVNSSDIDAYLREYDFAANLPGAFQIEVPTQGGRQEFSYEKSNIPGSKVLDTGMLLPNGQNLCFAPKINLFLEAIFEEKALAFQTLHFEVGSTQAIHQDTAYVVVEQEPLKLVASWIALEDIQPGSGELTYYVGGHRIREYAYAEGTSKHWEPQRDGNPNHDQHLSYLHEESARLGLERQSFLPKKGDALLWHADLPHGGGEILNPGTSRRSLVTHYCPRSNDPHYAEFIPEPWRIKTPAAHGNAFMSLYFDPKRISKVS